MNWTKAILESVSALFAEISIYYKYKIHQVYLDVFMV